MDPARNGGGKMNSDANEATDPVQSGHGDPEVLEAYSCFIGFDLGDIKRIICTIKRPKPSRRELWLSSPVVLHFSATRIRYDS